MSSLNKVLLIGNLGKNPEVKLFENDRKRVTFSLATSRKFKNKNGEVIDKTTWHNIVIWSPLSEIAIKFLSKGKSVYLEGEIETREYTTPDNEIKYFNQVVVRQIVLLNNREQNREYTPNTSDIPDTLGIA